MSQFIARKKHVDEEARRLELSTIEKKLVEHDFPPQLVIENTSVCNIKCIHCSHREMLRFKEHMSREIHDKIVEEVGREAPNCEIWPTFYGEALILHEELWERIDYADSVGCKNLVLNSNGTLLEKHDNIEKILNSPLKRFILSLDGLSKETFEKIRAGAKWDVVYPATEKLCRLRKERGQTYPSITAQFSVMEDNAHEAEDYRKYWTERGAEVKIRPMLEWTATGTVRSETIDRDSEFRIACPWGNNTMAIHSNGNAVACAIDYEGLFVVGNVKDHTVKELWHMLGERLRKHHREHNWDKLPTICKGCGDWQVAGATYEDEQVEGTRPFWYDEESSIGRYGEEDRQQES